MRPVKEEWIGIVKEQEALLRFERFTREDALRLGLKIVELAKDKYHHGVAVWVAAQGAILFSHMMDGTSLENELWMRRKINTFERTGVSTLRTCLEEHYEGKSCAPWFDNEGNYVLCGGCFPIFDQNGGTLGYAVASGLDHYEDHQLIADAMAEMLEIEIPTVI